MRVVTIRRQTFASFSWTARGLSAVGLREIFIQQSRAFGERFLRRFADEVVVLVEKFLVGNGRFGILFGRVGRVRRRSIRRGGRTLFLQILVALVFIMLGERIAGSSLISCVHQCFALGVRLLG